MNALVRGVPVLLLVLLNATAVAAQTPGLWSDKPEERMRRPQDREIFPVTYRTVELRIDALQELLALAPDETDIPPTRSDVVLTVPAPDGNYQRFRIVEYAMMEPGLAVRYPEVKTYRGVALDNPFRTIRCDWTARGFSAVVTGPGGQYIIDPYARRNQEDYIVYYKADYPGTGETFECFTQEERDTPRDDRLQRISGDCTFRSYRLAVATRGEYSNFHDAFGPEDADTVLAAVVIAINRVNEVYERDVAVRLVLIANTDDVFYYDGSSDPYSGNPCQQLGQNQTTLDNVIGSANYDVGHVFGTSGGGCASLEAPCTGWKAGGATGLSEPIGDVFWIDYLSHELGHQFGGNHTQNNSCGHHSPTAFEPGSASTIMGYAGICDPNVQSNSDDYFHGISVQEINNFTAFGDGDNCDLVITPWNNTAPVVIPGQDYTIPVSTPFALTASATDADGDPLTYCWEQWDNEVGSMPPTPTNTQGPMFRSFDPGPSPTRFFPRLTELVQNNSPTWEVLPSVGRDMEFRITVRDFHDGLAGCASEDNVHVTTTASAGPFVVTAPNTGAVQWSQLAEETVTWNVANTHNAPVNCTSVDIFLSRDGGLTYPDTLATGVPNNGSATVIVPEGATDQARVMIMGSDNIFFDISNEDFSIVPGFPDYDLLPMNAIQEVCNSDTAHFTIEVISLAGYEEPVTLSLIDPPAGIQFDFSPNPVIPGASGTLSVWDLDALNDPSYTLTIEGNSAAGVHTAEVTVHIQEVPPEPALIAPADHATEVSLTAELIWNVSPGSSSYEIQVATDYSFGNVVISTTATEEMLIVDDVLTTLTTYFWRVRAVNACGGSWSEVREFQTLLCEEVMSPFVPIDIPPSGGSSAGSSLSLPDIGIIEDLDVINVTGTHASVSELEVSLNIPTIALVTLFSGICGSDNAFDLNFDDEAAPGAIPCPPVTGLSYQPVLPLSVLDGQVSGSALRLIVEDMNAAENDGTLESWGVRVCVTDFDCNTEVKNTNDNGPGSLRTAVGCAANGDTITFAAPVQGSTIVLNSPLEITQDLFIQAATSESISTDATGVSHAFDIPVAAAVEMEGFTIIGGSAPEGAAIHNSGQLTLTDITVVSGGGMPGGKMIKNAGALTLKGTCNIAQ